MHVLIAEDEKDLLDQYEDMLEEKGHKVTAYVNGDECLKIYRIESGKQIKDMMKEPFHRQALGGTLEDKEIYQKLEKLNVDSAAIKELNPSHAQIQAYFDVLCQLQKGRTF